MGRTHKALSDRMLLDSAHAASGGPPFDSAAVPETVVLVANRSCLRLTWSAEAPIDLGAERLRAACRCAWCTRARIDGTFAATFNDIAIAALAPVGDYAINIGFSDGHARGIYPWTYLRVLARETEGPARSAAAGTTAQCHGTAP